MSEYEFITEMEPHKQKVLYDTETDELFLFQYHACYKTTSIAILNVDVFAVVTAPDTIVFIGELL